MSDKYDSDKYESGEEGETGEPLLAYAEHVLERNQLSSPENLALFKACLAGSLTGKRSEAK